MTTEARFAWENIYRCKGRVFIEPLARFPDLVKEFHHYGCTRILDLGCGNGRHVLALAKEGFRAVGLDAALTGLNLAQAWLVDEGFEGALVLGDMTRSLPFPTEWFDGLMATQVIHHALLEDIRGVIAEIHRVLKPGGLAFVTVPAKPDDEMTYREVAPGTCVPLRGDEANVPHHYFTLEAFRGEFCEFEMLELSIRGDHVVFAFTGRKL